jgi:Raf kinase inhibitor-like YbhB/YbcL family protein
VRRAVLVLLLLVLAACGGGGGSGTDLEQGPSATGFRFTGASDVRSGEPIGVRFTCDGDDVAPELAWKAVPAGTAQLAFALEDPDAPGGTFTHWLVYGLAASSTGITAGRLHEGENDFDTTGYRGPCPPQGDEHDYLFRLFALDAPVELEDGATRQAFDEAVAPHVLAEARLVAPYRRGSSP